MKGTRIDISDALNQGKYITLVLQAKLLGLVRTEVWQRFDGLSIGEVKLPYSYRQERKKNSLGLNFLFSIFIDNNQTC